MSVGKVYALCLRLVPDIAIAEKLTADVFIATWSNINFFREDTLFTSWLTGIATFTVLEWVRGSSGSWTSLNLKKARSVKPDISDSSFDADIQGLPDKERFVFVLHDIEKYSVDEVSDLLSISKSSVGDILLSAYELLNPAAKTVDAKAYIEHSLTSLPEIIQPKADVWRYVFTAIHKAKGHELTVEIADIPVDKKEDSGKNKLFGLFSRKKK